MSTGLHARSVPLDYGPDALQFDGNPTVLFDRPGFTLVGWGTAVMLGATEVTDVLASIPCDDQVRRPGSGVLALGALPFIDALYGTGDRAPVHHGHRPGTRAARRIGGPPWWAPKTIRYPDTAEALDSVIWQYDTTAEGARAGRGDRGGLDHSLVE